MNKGFRVRFNRMQRNTISPDTKDWLEIGGWNTLYEVRWNGIR